MMICIFYPFVLEHDNNITNMDIFHKPPISMRHANIRVTNRFLNIFSHRLIR